ncbi:hypothetical protein H5P28_11630 [Ruficoccus amylovorans]|uniref:Acb2/Tad1 hairpin domain-containing protein n=1 Tax=Ruficoccus amylovorans TaxID=1804625 RepID=A0A842HFU5_9BACT|nr:hypothetical protein [Ruficoccus amylovorans]MBC2594908.1 hypothetical protein [Ruficoccus amylovorans]
MKFKKKPITIDAITFDELVEHGLKYGGNTVEGVPWSFQYNGHAVTHETDDCYIISTLEGDMKMTRGDMLLIGITGEIYPCKLDIFEASYDPCDDAEECLPPHPMRPIHDHVVNGLNEAIDVLAVDEPGPGGANHEYALRLNRDREKSLHDTTIIRFQNGPIQESGFNGLSNEALLAVLIDRMRGFQHQREGDNPERVPGFNFASRGKYACKENACALTHLEEAMMWLQKRTRDRMARGVEGTHKV